MIAAICVAAVPAASAAGKPVELMFARGDVYGSGAFQAMQSYSVMLKWKIFLIQRMYNSLFV